MKPSSYLLVLSMVQALPSLVCAEPAQVASERADVAAPGDVEAARAHFTRGVQFYNNGDYKLSLLEFRRSYELSRNYRVLYNIGQVNQQLSNYAKALAALEEYLREGGAEITDDRRREVTSSVAELTKKIAVLELVFDVGRAEVLIDDVSHGALESRTSLTIDAGDHRVEVRRDGHESATLQVTLSAGESKRLELRLPKRKLAAPVAPAPTRAVEPAKSKTLLWVGWIATGTIAAGAGITGALATSHASELATLRNSPDSTASERQAEGDKARAFAIASDAMTGAAVAVGLTSLYFTLFPKDSAPERRRESATRVELSPFGASLIHRY